MKAASHQCEEELVPLDDEEPSSDEPLSEPHTIVWPDDDHTHVLWSVRVFHLLSATTARLIVHLAETHASAIGGWRTTRHAHFPTTDFALEAQSCAPTMRALDDLVRPIVNTVVLPTLALHYQCAEVLTVRDLFLVRYEASTAAAPTQDRLPLHRDGNLLSFSIMLSEPGVDFDGGGLRFVSVGPRDGFGDRQPIAGVGCGDLTLHCGKLLHEALRIRRGRRYLIVGFVHVAVPLQISLSSFVGSDANVARTSSARSTLVPSDHAVMRECTQSGLMLEDERTGARYTSIEVAPPVGQAATHIQAYVRGAIVRGWMPLLVS